MKITSKIFATYFSLVPEYKVLQLERLFLAARVENPMQDISRKTNEITTQSLDLLFWVCYEGEQELDW